MLSPNALKVLAAAGTVKRAERVYSCTDKFILDAVEGDQRLAQEAFQELVREGLAEERGVRASSIALL